jgi:hypothetical protein
MRKHRDNMDARVSIKAMKIGQGMGRGAHLKRAHHMVTGKRRARRMS